MLAFYTLTGGIAKYVELFIEQRAFTLDEQLNLIFDEHSLFLEEGKNLLIEEFGKEYTTYFSILSLIASSKTSRTEIESILTRDIGGYLDRLENEYSIIRKIRPMFAKEQSRSVKYEIEDNFFNFWFRFIYKYKSAIEIENFSFVKEMVKNDFPVFSGKFLEKYFIEKMKPEGHYEAIGNYWEKQNKNEIDIVALNSHTKELAFVEIKRNPNKINPNLLKSKAVNIVNSHPDYQTRYLALSLEDM